MKSKRLNLVIMLCMATFALVHCNSNDGNANQQNPSGNVSGALTVSGSYAVNEAEDTCSHGSDRDEFCVAIEDGVINHFAINDDFVVVIHELSDSTLDITFTEGVDCDLIFNDDGSEVEGDCAATDGSGDSCHLAYVRLATDDKAFVADPQSVDNRALDRPVSCSSEDPDFNNFDDQR